MRAGSGYLRVAFSISSPATAMKWASSSIAWPVVSSPLYFRGGVTPAGSGTCATFSVIDTRL